MYLTICVLDDQNFIYPGSVLLAPSTPHQKSWRKDNYPTFYIISAYFYFSPREEDEKEKRSYLLMKYK